MAALFGGIEAGTSQFVCAVGDGLGGLNRFLRFETTTPEETLGRAVHFFEQQPGPVEAVGVGAFGPLDLNPRSGTYGTIGLAPQERWRNTSLRGVLKEALHVPVVVETGANAAVVGEKRFGAGQDADNLLFVNVGASVGAGSLIHGRCVHGLGHPEMGHLRVCRAPGDDFDGLCAYHDGCLHGMISGPAIEKRTGTPARDLPDDHPVWELVARYLGEALATCTLLLSPEKIVVGGGVMQREALLPRVRQRVAEVLAGYPAHPALVADGLGAYIVPSALHTRPGVLGALALARDAQRGRHHTGETNAW